MGAMLLIVVRQSIAPLGRSYDKRLRAVAERP